MPELPEIETVKRSLTPKLIGRPLTGVVARRGGLRSPFPDFSALIGQHVQGVERRSKYLLMQFPTGDLLLHLGMSGSLSWVDSDALAGKHDHLDLVFGEKCVRLRDPRRFGMVAWQPQGQTHRCLAQLGPEPLDDGFTGATLHDRIRGRTTPIKVALMDPRIVVGVGNIYASEALFRAGIDPRKEARGVSRKKCEALVGHVKDVLNEGIAKGGSTLRDFHGVEGQVGEFAHAMQVYGRTGEDCDVCGCCIKTTRLGGRASAWCPKCQH